MSTELALIITFAFQVTGENQAFIWHICASICKITFHIFSIMFALWKLPHNKTKYSKTFMIFLNYLINTVRLYEAPYVKIKHGKSVTLNFTTKQFYINWHFRNLCSFSSTSFQILLSTVIFIFKKGVKSNGTKPLYFWSKIHSSFVYYVLK